MELDKYLEKNSLSKRGHKADKVERITSHVLTHSTVHHWPTTKEPVPQTTPPAMLCQKTLILAVAVKRTRYWFVLVQQVILVVAVTAVKSKNHYDTLDTDAELPSSLARIMGPVYSSS